MVEVTVRREELVVDADDTAVASDTAGPIDGWRGTVLDGPPLDEPPSRQVPTVIVLREEVPEIALRVQAYERVTVRVEQVTASVEVGEQLSHEQVELDVVKVGDPVRSGL